MDWKQKDYRGWSKVVNRRAMAGILPDEVRWSTPRFNLSNEFWTARSTAIWTHADGHASSDVLEALAPFIEVSRAREAYDHSLAEAIDVDLDVWTYYVLARWLQRAQQDRW